MFRTTRNNLQRFPDRVQYFVQKRIGRCAKEAVYIQTVFVQTFTRNINVQRTIYVCQPQQQAQQLNHLIEHNTPYVCGAIFCYLRLTILFVIFKTIDSIGWLVSQGEKCSWISQICCSDFFNSMIGSSMNLNIEVSKNSAPLRRQYGRIWSSLIIW